MASDAIALSVVTFTDRPGTTGGGEFHAQTAADGDFPTFCLEYTEHIAFGGTYYYGVSQEAKYNGSFPNTDPLSRPTAWLYLHFRNGILPGYSSTDALANELQRAIWFLEGEIGGINNSYAQLAIAASGFDPSVANNGFYPVGVMNLWANADGTDPRQDQLILISVPDGIVPVPDGGTTIALWGVGLFGLGVFCRRLRA